MLLNGLVRAAPDVPLGKYDLDLCVTAQRMIVNAADDAFPVVVQRGTGSGFHTIQMDIDAGARVVQIAMTTGTVAMDGEPLSAYVACKMVNRERVNDVLALQLSGPRRSCRDVNEHTYQTAVTTLSPGERERYESAGHPLRFVDDYVAATGGEWLPAAVDDYIEAVDAAAGSYLQIRAPSVRVPWDPDERSFFQGTHHCKLITLAAMQRWMRSGALAADQALFPRTKPACTAPSTLSSTAGSCLFYFAPAATSYCQDYSGPDWTETSARAECGNRHASPEALRAAQNRYDGAGGVFSTIACAARADVPRITGTCVFNCNAGDETLWHLTGDMPAEPAAARMMTRACDLFIEP